jgi:hypothetical protein
MALGIAHHQGMVDALRVAVANQGRATISAQRLPASDNPHSP